MAVYKYQTYLQQSNHEAFDRLHHPGEHTPHSGIYRCEVCGINDVSTYGHPLPPQNHHQHPSGLAIRWRLVAATK